MNILITGAGSYVGTSVERWLRKDPNVRVDTIDTYDNHWRSVDFTKYDVIFHVAGIAHVNANPQMAPQYYKVNRDLTVDIAICAKNANVKQFIFMSSMIVYHESQTLDSEVITFDTIPMPNGFYGDSKLQAEIAIKQLETAEFKVCVLRPPMIYGPNSKGNFPKLVKLARFVPVFPAYHNQRSMLYIDNLAEFVRLAIKYELSGTFYPQNKELSDTVEIVKFFAHEAKHKVYLCKWLNPLVRIASRFLQPVNKMFATYYYDMSMSKMDFDYQVVSFKDSLKIISDSYREKY